MPTAASVVGLPTASEGQVGTIAHELIAAYPARSRHPLRFAENRAMQLVGENAGMKSALFRLVDVVPACKTDADVRDHLAALLKDAGVLRGALARRGAAASRAGDATVAMAVRLAVHALARRFIVGADAASAAPMLGALWSHGAATSVDLLGEATVTAAEADRYAARCLETLEQLALAAKTWPDRPALEHDSVGVLPRVNLSVKVSALTPLVRPNAPDRGVADVARRLRVLLRRARDLGAHLHIDMESMASREMTWQLVFGILEEEEFRAGPSAGIVLQAYLVDSDEMAAELIARAAEQRREAPLTVRLVKGAYWDHETVEAIQQGWHSPVFTVKADSDRRFEHLTRVLLAARPAVRVAIASHNVRSVAHAIAVNRATGAAPEDLEIQVLRGLGDDLQDALVARGQRVRTYSPIGDLIAGMSYLVRRLLENSSNDSFLAQRASGNDLDSLLRRP